MATDGRRQSGIGVPLIELHAGLQASGRRKRGPATYFAMACYGLASVLYLVGHLHGWGRAAVAAVDVALLAGMVAYTKRSFAVSRLRLVGSELWYRGAFRERLIGRSHAAGTMVRLRVGPHRGNYTDYVVVQNAQGRATALLGLAMWPVGELRRLGTEMGMRWVDGPTCKDFKALARQYPGSLPWPFAHPVLASLTLIAVPTAGIALLQAV